MSLEIIVLAAGQGTRMRSALPKVLHTIAGRPMLAHVLDTARSLSPQRIHVVVGHGADQVREQLEAPDIAWVVQEEQLGTGHAVLQALPGVQADSRVLVLYGDVPLIKAGTLTELLEQAVSGPALLTANMVNPAGYGRVVRDAAGNLQAVVEHKDATASQREISEINTGVMAAPASDFNRYLPKVGNDNSQGEYYLPDVLALAVAEDRLIASAKAATELEVQGINDRLQQQALEREYQRRVGEELLMSGVALADAARLDVRGTLTCGADVFIDINAVIEGDVHLADGVQVGPNCMLSNVTLGAGSVVHAMSHLQDATVGKNCNIGPFARIRPGTELGDSARIGNFVETKKARIGAGSKVNHLSYVGDCDMGDTVNVGAGTITCNYDGVNKHQTVIGDNVFVGSNSTLIAPITIEDNGFIAAGSTITKPVADGDLAVSRARQRNVAGWQRPQTGDD
ncbi:bifunctional UDP-N-acetylglucosamine diphosphorylase/glucosamine-1-phosphate N-acetyltransferase GlmU [Parahalioglobus pacificus]|uniref:Bifunctional protein GlmU n=1 Tax=Parahalioglobus pacificus TaxID=930806 RepID=A0A918XJH4_9GAMM|nr:bifunctional UDP-N-acetylglucosamine diphosphorylase/glucosamine-1-phosphate N-acetyltransferase GlmU [Halioglobus pacificus]GHD34886.1 bifunctional protein GlmU [Halioglobus pacificus]